jgi:hypothetical protein
MIKLSTLLLELSESHILKTITRWKNENPQVEDKTARALIQRFEQVQSSLETKLDILAIPDELKKGNKYKSIDNYSYEDMMKLIRSIPENPDKVKKAKGANPYAEIINWFGDSKTLLLDDNSPFNEYKKSLNSVPGLKELVKKLHPTLSNNQQLLLMEFVLHGLAEFSQLNKGFLDNGFAFSDMFNSLFNLEPDDDLDLDDDRY